MKTQIVIGLICLLAGGLASAMWWKEQVPLMVTVEQWDIPIAVGMETRINVPEQYHGYYITSLMAFHTTAGSEAGSDATEIEVKDITNAVVIDTIDIAEALLKGESRDVVLYEIISAGTELSFRVIETMDTPGEGLRIICKITDENSIRK